MAVARCSRKTYREFFAAVPRGTCARLSNLADDGHNERNKQDDNARGWGAHSGGDFVETDSL